ncbi:MAG: mechanosensitive ion channel family protein [Candidatus Eremiobacterota bacterium]
MFPASEDMVNDDTSQAVLYSTLLSFGLLIVLLALYNWCFRIARPRLMVLRVLQERLRWLVLGNVFFFPFWYGLTRLMKYHAYAELLLLAQLFLGTMVLFEVGFCVLFRYRPGGGAQVPRPLRWGIRVASYGLLLYLLVRFHPEAALFEASTRVSLVSLFFTYLMMHVTYTYFFKWVQWRHPLAVAITRRVRMWSYLTVLVLVAFYAFSNFGFFDHLPPYTIKQIQDYFRLALVTLLVLIALDGLVAAVFDYYFPVIQKVVIPHIFRDMIRGVVYLAVTLIVIGLVLHKDLSTFILGSTVVSIIIGLALQETLGNFFSGLALGLSKPYNLGDDLKVGETQGRVEKIDWRSTALLTQTGDYILMPNSVLAKVEIQNFSAPSRNHARFVDVGTHYRHPPNVVKRAVLEAAYSVHEVLSDPRPEVWLVEFADSSINYRLRFWITNYQQRFAIESKVREAIWYRFSRDGIEIPFPMRNIIQVEPEATQDLTGEVRNLLDKVDFLEALKEEELAILSRRIRYQLFARGEKVCQQGEPGDSFYIIKSGRLRVSARNEKGEIFLSIEMQGGQYFGEMALLTGEPRSATVEALEDSELLMLDKEDLRTIMRDNPDAGRVISTKLAQRQLRTERAREEQEERQKSVDESGKTSVAQRLDILSEQFMRKIRDFFSY